MFSNVSIRIRFIFVLIVMLLLNAFAYYSIFRGVYEEELRTQARVVVDNVESFGAWVTENGGVWVTNDRSFLAHRTLVDPETSKTVDIYSKNPALATREYSEQIAKSNSSATFRMTSDNFMNPKNKPDAFEFKAIKSISSKTASEDLEFFEMVNGRYRYAKPVYHTEGCIRCHGKPEDAPQSVVDFPNRVDGFGFKTGDLAGVISVELKTQPLFQRLLQILLGSYIEIGFILVSFFMVLYFVWDRILKPIKRLSLVADAVSKGQEVELNTNKMDESSGNEVFQLTLALSRLKNSYEYTANKLGDIKSKIEKAKLKKRS